MLRQSRGRPTSAPPGFIHPCRPIVAKRPPVGPGWVHELKHDGYRLQIHVRDGRVRRKLLDMSRQGRVLGAAACEFVERMTGEAATAIV